MLKCRSPQGAQATGLHLGVEALEDRWLPSLLGTWSGLGAPFRELAAVITTAAARASVVDHFPPVSAQTGRPADNAVGPSVGEHGGLADLIHHFWGDRASAIANVMGPGDFSLHQFAAARGFTEPALASAAEAMWRQDFAGRIDILEQAVHVALGANDLKRILARKFDAVIPPDPAEGHLTPPERLDRSQPLLAMVLDRVFLLAEAESLLFSRRGAAGSTREPEALPLIAQVWARTAGADQGRSAGALTTPSREGDAAFPSFLPQSAGLHGDGFRIQGAAGGGSGTALEGTNDLLLPQTAALSAPFLPQHAGLLGDIFPMDVADLEQGLQTLLGKIDDAGKPAVPDSSGVLPVGWFLAGLVASAVGVELMRRRLTVPALGLAGRFAEDSTWSWPSNLSDLEPGQQQ